MTAEDGAPTMPVEVVRCEPPRLIVRTGPDGWVLTVRIEYGGGDGGHHLGADDRDDDGDDDGVTLALEHRIADAASAADIGPGWDYYLDRLVEAESGRDPESLSFERDYHPALSGHYRALLGG